MSWEIRNDHKEILDKIFNSFDNASQLKILDAGTGRTSLKFLIDKFTNAFITAVTYPGDNRKIESIKRSIVEESYSLIECDLIDLDSSEPYDVVLAHLLLGEANCFGNNTFEKLLNKLFSLNSRYLVIVDFREDPNVVYKDIEALGNKLGRIVKKVEVDRVGDFVSKDFIGKTYIGYLVELKKSTS